MKTLKTIEQLNSDLFLADCKILWTGQTVQLWNAGLTEFLTVLRADDQIVAKIVRWLNKNSMRCSQIHDNRIWL